MSVIQETSKTAPFPANGANTQKRENTTTQIIAGVCIAIGIFIAIPVFTHYSSPRSSLTPTQKAISESVADTPYTSIKNTSPSTWIYNSKIDPMTDRLTRWACVSSTNQIQQNRPYSNVFARLCIRSSPTMGLDTYIVLEGDGQILCRSYNDCTLKVRFDDNSISSFSGTEPSDNSTNFVFISNSTRFLENVKKADRTIIELVMYQSGNQTLSFPTKELQWPIPES